MIHIDSSTPTKIFAPRNQEEVQICMNRIDSSKGSIGTENLHGKHKWFPIKEVLILRSSKINQLTQTMPHRKMYWYREATSKAQK